MERSVGRSMQDVAPGHRMNIAEIADQIPCFEDFLRLAFHRQPLPLPLRHSYCPTWLLSGPYPDRGRCFIEAPQTEGASIKHSRKARFGNEAICTCATFCSRGIVREKLHELGAIEGMMASYFRCFVRFLFHAAVLLDSDSDVCTLAHSALIESPLLAGSAVSSRRVG